MAYWLEIRTGPAPDDADTSTGTLLAEGRAGPGKRIRILANGQAGHALLFRDDAPYAVLDVLPTGMKAEKPLPGRGTLFLQETLLTAGDEISLNDWRIAPSQRIAHADA